MSALANDNNFRKLTVFGAAGRIGSAVINRAEQIGIQNIVKMPRHFTRIDLEDLGHVIFAAGLTADFRQRYHDTMTAHVSLLNEVLEYGIFDSLTYLSSTRLYQNASHTGCDATFDVSPINPSDIYTLSKLAGEALCMQSGQNVKIARLSNVVGKGESGHDTFIGQISKAANEGHIYLNSSLKSEKDYIWLEDISNLLLETPLRAKDKIYNFASGKNISHEAWIKELRAATGCNLSIDEDALEIKFDEIDISATKRDFNFKPSPLLSKIQDICIRVGNG